MKLLYLLLIFTCITAAATAQLPSNRLPLYSVALKLDVSPQEQLIVTSKGGEIAMADSIRGYWRSVHVDRPGKPVTGLHIERATFFNHDTGFISGFLPGSRGKYDIIYRTTDFGKNWTAVELPQSGWADAASWLDNGEAWLTVAGNGMVHTTDFGATWDGTIMPQWGNGQRYTQLFFNQDREGITGSGWNIIMIHRPGASSWEKIPTPLDQHKYAKTDTKSRPAINDVAIYKNYLLANQENMIFYSRKDTINWIPLPDYNNFYTDAANTALYFRRDNNQFVKADEQLQPLFNYNTTATYYDAVCRNASLFLLGEGEITQLKPDQQIITAGMYTTDSVDTTPDIIGDAGKKVYGISGNEIFVQNEEEDVWNHYLTLPIRPEDISDIHINNFIIRCGAKKDSLYTYNIRKRKALMKANKDVIRDFCRAGIKSIAFANGSQGCDEQRFNKLTFRKIKGGFKAVNLLPGQDTVTFIDKAPVLDFISNIPLLPGKKTTIQQLDFTGEDYAQCKNDILALQQDINNNKLNIHVNNLDFKKLLAMVDSVKTIDPASLNNMLLNMEDIISTTSFTKSLILVNRHNEMMTLYHSYYETYTPWAFPWEFSINGVRGMSNAIEIPRFIREVFPSFLGNPDKIAALHTLVKKRYMSQK